MARKIILDVDTGSDDAVAIMTAILSEDIDLVALCSVMGNRPIENTNENTLRVVQAMGANVPVYKGAAKPVAKDLHPNRDNEHPQKSVVFEGKEYVFHQDHLELPEAKIKEERMSAPAFYVDYLRHATEKTTIVLVGPLTNFALALTIDPSIVNNVEEIIVMGGGCHITNSTPSAEFNIWADPEAANRVIKCGAKVTLVPLDATHAAYITKSDCERFRALGTVAGDFAAKLCEQRIIMHNVGQPLEVPDAAAVHDALAVCYIIDPAVLKDVKHVHCNVGMSDFSEGQTIVDERYYPDEPNCYFAFNGDPKRFADLLCDIFKNGPKS